MVADFRPAASIGERAIPNPDAEQRIQCHDDGQLMNLTVMVSAPVKIGKSNPSRYEFGAY
jgi:hypothetical protein